MRNQSQPQTSKAKEGRKIFQRIAVRQTYPSSLLMKSPYPGVSTTVNLNLTPFSSISIVPQQKQKKNSKQNKDPKLAHSLPAPCSKNHNLPAVILSMDTVLDLSWAGPGIAFLPYKEVLKRVLMRVDFPNPDSPDKVEGRARALVRVLLSLGGRARESKEQETYRLPWWWSGILRNQKIHVSFDCCLPAFERSLTLPRTFTDWFAMDLIRQIGDCEWHPVSSISPYYLHPKKGEISHPT